MSRCNLSVEEVKKIHSENYEKLRKLTISKSWVDENGCLCIRYSNGEWFHYYCEGNDLYWY